MLAIEKSRPRLRPLRAPLPVLLWASGPALAVVLAGALVLSASAGHPFFQAYDDAWNVALDASRTPWLTTVNKVLDFVGNTGMILYGAALFLALLVRHRRLALFTAGANLGTLGVTHLLKFLVGRDRPLDRLVHVSTASYPSGHVSATVAAMVATAVALGRLWMWASGAVLSVAMIYSRMYLGAHWLSDTIAGALLGLGLTLLLWALARDTCLERHVVQRPLPS
ncbi:phosphatase PAP2 family protein [Arthrobacter sp. SDTb3-6]|uniref:phosphatase PAP2 family protein n=1 Tax=Arthrobacter sp. SDTb3-6 TaxID=2713571 RepID=UPI00159D6D98|nr:phosphatase PAP2 family protein [Arthrobacter sp. SDTb3-6]